MFHSEKEIKSRKTLNIPHTPQEIRKSIIEAIIFGIFLSIALGIGYFLNLTNPYWVAVACIAVMQGNSTQHVFQRSVQRIIGTLIGVVFLLGNTFICKKSVGNMYANNNPSIYCRIFSSKKLWNSNDFYNATYNFFCQKQVHYLQKVLFYLPKGDFLTR